MKHTLKTLLVTSVLSTASVFGADAMQGDAHETTKENQLVSQKTKVRANTGSLGLIFCDMFSEITGATNPRTNNPQIVSLGYLPLEGLNAIARTSKFFHEFAQPMLDRAKALRSNILTILRNPIPVFDKNTLALLDWPSTPQTMGDFFQIVISDSFASLSAADISIAHAYIQNSNLDRLEKDFLISAKPDATPEDMLYCTSLMILVDSVNTTIRVNDVMRLCNQLLNHDDATITHLFQAAGYLASSEEDLGQNFFEATAYLCEKAANHRNATLCDIKWAANSLDLLGKEFADRSAAIYEKATNHPDATQFDIFDVAGRLRTLGEEFAERSASIYEKSANHRNATLHDIMDAADVLKSLGKDYYYSAAVLYEKAAKHRDASPFNMIEAAYRLHELGKEFAERSASIYEKAAKHNDCTSLDIWTAVSAIERIRNTYPTDSSEYKKYDALTSEIRRIKESRGL